MKMLVTGGNRGLGLILVNHFNAVSISRQQGYDITKDTKAIAEKSLDYDVFVKMLLMVHRKKNGLTSDKYRYYMMSIRHGKPITKKDI